MKKSFAPCESGRGCGWQAGTKPEEDDRPRLRSLEPLVEVIEALASRSFILPRNLPDRRIAAVNRVKGLPVDFRRSLLDALSAADNSGEPVDLESGLRYGRRDVHGVMASCPVNELALLFNRRVEVIGETTWRFHPDRSVRSKSKALAA